MTITHKLSKTGLVLDIPFELIRHLAETDEEGQFIVYNVRKLANRIGEQIVESDTEEGLKSQILELIKEAYEDGDDYITSRLSEIEDDE